MQNRLPLTIDPIRSAQQRLDFVGIYPAAKLTRLNEVVEKIKTDADCQLSFYYDEQRLPVVKIETTIVLELMCQRCFESFNLTVFCENKLSPVKNETQIANLPDYYDPAPINEFGEIDILSLVEDEIILALPLAPKHKEQECAVTEKDYVFGSLPQEDDKPNPFSILTRLKDKPKE